MQMFALVALLSKEAFGWVWQGFVGAIYQTRYGIYSAKRY
jgi:hypothetical protein